MDFTKHKDKLLFVPLGGAEEIGMNLYLYHYNDKWIIVDMGIGFADDHYPGVDLLVPDISFLLTIKDKIAGIVLTHAHEDHIGAVQYLWNELRVPIYTTKFTASIVKAKCSEAGTANTEFIKEVKENKKFKIADFELEFIGLTHSVPEMQGLVIKTDRGTLFHTGDWKLDNNPIVGDQSNIARLKSLGDEGVLAMICDSTNIFNEGRSGSEGDLAEHLRELVCSHKKGLVVVTTFASNIARVHSLAKAAEAAGRKVVLAGRSLWRMTDAARQCGYMDDLPEFIKTRDMGRFKKHELLVIATGCQGERLAAISRLSREDHPDFKLTAGDMVIFSSKIIPGNEMKILPLFNNFARNKVKVMTENDHYVHVSGHPSRGEVEDMYKYIRPKVAIPVHGEVVHTFEHVEFAKSLGVQTAFRVDNGHVVSFENGTAEIIGKTQSGLLAIDGNFLLDKDSNIFKERRRMRDNGILHITVIINGKNKLLKSPYTIAPGVLDGKEDSEYFDMINLEIRDYIESHQKLSISDLENKIRNIAKRIIAQEINKEPKILVSIHKLSL